jgi:hypothetical protein
MRIWECIRAGDGTLQIENLHSLPDVLWQEESRMLVFRNMEMSSLNSNIISFPTVADKMEVWITPSSYYVFEFFSLTRPLHGVVSAFASKLNGGTLVAYRSYTKVNYHLSLVMRAIGSPSECGIRYYN